MSWFDDAKQEVLRATDIVSLVGRHVELQRSGRAFKARCPFHEERTPSFQVSPDRQRWRCFGRCAEGGNAIDFLMKREGIDFVEALRRLAAEAGIALPARAGGPTEADAEAVARKEAYDVQELAQEFFRRSLLGSREGALAREYVAGRGVDEEWAERFGIGYAPRRGGFLLRFLAKRGFSAEQAARAGLAKAREGDGGAGCYEFFRGRLIFPIHDVLGRVVGFGGRALFEEDGQRPKYLNSPDTAVFHKREQVYGLHQAKEAVRERREAAVCEGYVDVILAHQAGFPWFVAPLGTAFAPDHARLLAKHAQRLTLIFDGDAAGAHANRRTLVETARAGIGLFKELRVAALPRGLDPADLIVQRGPAALADALGRASGVADFFLAAAGAGTAEREQALKELSEVLAGFDDEVRLELEVARAAHTFRVPEEVVRKLVKGFRDRALGRSAAAASRDIAAAARPQAPEQAPASPPVPREQWWALVRMVASEECLEDARSGGVPIESFGDPRARALAETLYGPPGALAGVGGAARELLAEIERKIDPALDYRADWRGVKARLAEARDRDEPACTKEGCNELQESVLKKRRQLERRRRDMGLQSFGGTGEGL